MIYSFPTLAIKDKNGKEIGYLRGNIKKTTITSSGPYKNKKGVVFDSAYINIEESFYNRDGKLILSVFSQLNPIDSDRPTVITKLDSVSYYYNPENRCNKVAIVKREKYIDTCSFVQEAFYDADGNDTLQRQYIVSGGYMGIMEYVKLRKFNGNRLSEEYFIRSYNPNEIDTGKSVYKYINDTVFKYGENYEKTKLQLIEVELYDSSDNLIWGRYNAWDTSALFEMVYNYDSSDKQLMYGALDKSGKLEYSIDFVYENFDAHGNFLRRLTKSKGKVISSKQRIIEYYD